MRQKYFTNLSCFCLIVVVFDNLLHHVVSRVIREVGNDGDFFVCLCLGGDFCVIDYNLGVENFLFDALVEIVGTILQKVGLVQETIK